MVHFRNPMCNQGNHNIRKLCNRWPKNLGSGQTLMSTEGLTRNDNVRGNQIEIHFNQRRAKETRYKGYCTHNECIENGQLKVFNHRNVLLQRYLYYVQYIYWITEKGWFYIHLRFY